ncbi:MAG: 30S ribosomal protein S17 [Patescibacteria group bacterium]
MRSQKFHVHTEGTHTVGDQVMFRECKPFSKTKCWIVAK